MILHERLLLPVGMLVFAGALLLAEACARDGDTVRLLVATGLVFGLATWVKPAGQFLFFAAPFTVAVRRPRSAPGAPRSP